MDFLKLAIVAAFIAYGVKLYYYDGEQEVHVGGNVDPKFQKVKDAFTANLKDGWERGGGVFVVYHKGKKVVDLYGGYADKDSARLWKQDTMSIAFSATKAVGAICVAQLVDQGRLKYDDLVSKHWPEFAKNEKENITVRWVMGHRSGLPFTDRPIPYSAARDPKAQAKIFEDQRPVFPPGQATGYHAITYGWLIDQIIRRTDEKHRGIGQYYNEELRTKYDLDFYIGLPIELAYRVARIKAITFTQMIAEYLYAPNNFNLIGTIKRSMSGGFLARTSKSVPWINFVSQVTVNNPDLYTVEQAGALGIGTADALAQLFEKLRTGKLMSAETFKQLTSNYIEEEDLITGATVPRGQGFMIKNIKRGDKTHSLYGHSGYGGQNVRIDMDNEITLVYFSNHLKLGLGDTARTYIRLLDALYDSLEQI